MKYYKGFDKEAFLDYMEKAYDINQQTKNIISNIIYYAHEHEHVSKDQFCDFVAELVGDIEYSEVYAFAEDGILTAEGIRLKNIFLNSVWYKEV